MAELWGVYLALDMAWTVGFRKLYLESDSKALVESISRLNTNTGTGTILYHRIKDLFNRNWQ
ncbi:hypothetical protein PIB30_084764, partial [Stylosanthes scabra]|nr:hypothetical protein [Stylosanthes scabra]